MRHVADEDNADTDSTRMVIAYGRSLAAGSKFDGYWRALVERVLHPFFDYLTERVGEESSILYVLERCCPPEGTPFDTLAHPAARFAGKPVLASRAELAQTIAPVTGEEAEAMTRATHRAEAHARRLIREAGNRTGRKARRRALHGPGLLAVSEAITLYREGQSFPSRNAAAWLALVLEDLPVRDDAWARMDPDHNEAHRRLWTDVTRLARPGYAAAPAALLAFTAWQSGNGALANVALDRALADQPEYSMAKLLRQALDCGAPPSMARLPMTPEDVAASYNAQYSQEEDGDAESGSQTGHDADDEQVAGLVS
jgi:hypothetical protein